MRFVQKSTLSSAVFGLLLFTSCKKEINDNTPVPTVTDSSSAADLVKDSALDVAKDLYLWYKQIPATFNPRSYDDPDAIMTAIRQYSIEPGFTKPVDRWSFAMKQNEWNDVSSGIAGDFGLNVFFRDAADLRVKIVEQASPAGMAGIHRGWRITAINGNKNITTDNVDFVVNNVFYSTKTTFTFEKPDGTSTDVTLDAATYQENPIILDSVYSVGGKRIAYLAFNSFLGNTRQITNAFADIFSNFAAQQVTDMIVDLRYNGGGYVDLQEKLADYLAPLAADGNVMMKYQYNDKYTSENESVYFKKLGSLNLSRIFFIVSKSTASASELLINNLKPFVDVQILGPGNTYGKPVGFFPVPVGDWYVFPVSFRTTNKNGEGSYFNGMALNKQVADGLDKEWGDLQEACLASAVNYITYGAFLGRAEGRTSSFNENAEVRNSNDVLTKKDFKGTVDRRKLH